MPTTIQMKVTKAAVLDVVANRTDLATDTFLLNNAAVDPVDAVDAIDADVDFSANWLESVMECQSQLLDSLYFIRIRLTWLLYKSLLSSKILLLSLYRSILTITI